MNASGIGAAQELIDCFAKAIDKDDVRVIKVSIVNGNENAELSHSETDPWGFRAIGTSWNMASIG